MRQRPISVTVFGILNIGYALWKYAGLLAAGFLTHLKLPGNSAVANMQADPAYNALMHLNMVFTVVFGILLIASGIGLLLLQNWARILAVVYSVLEIIAVLVGAVFGHRVMLDAVTKTPIPGASPELIAAIAQISFVAGIFIALAYPILLLIFMTRRAIVEAFRSPNGQSPP